MENSRIEEIVLLVKNIANSVPMEQCPDEDKVKLLFQQLQSFSTACMNGSELQPELKGKIPVHELGRFSDSVRFVHESSKLFSSDKAPKIKACLRSIESILEGVLHSASPKPRTALSITPQKTKIFISYAREDVDMARRLHTDLKNIGCEVWIDLENLIPGQNWRSIIKNEIRSCSYFIALLSSHSLSKKGYVQKELKIALDVLDEFPPSEIFFIPVRIDDCTPLDERLRDIHFADLFPQYDEGLRKICKAISIQLDVIPPASETLRIKLKDIPDKDDDIVIFGKSIEHVYSGNERQTFFVFSSNTVELKVTWYYMHMNHGSISWQAFSKEPYFNSQNGQYLSPGWRTGNTGYKIKAVINYLDMEKELSWDSD